MAIKIVKADYKHGTTPNGWYDCEILADTEAEITALTNVVDDGTRLVGALPGSWAYTADMNALYQMSPSGVWMKTGG